MSNKLFMLVFMLAFALLACAILIVKSQRCGVPSRTVSLIHRGNDFNRGKWPWIAALLLQSDSQQKFFCGGVLISKTKVLTAAHCIQDKQRQRTKTRDIFVLLGAHDLNVRNIPGAFLVAPSEIVMHPDWNPYTEKYDADIAVIFTEDEIPFNKFIKPICIATSDLEITEGHVVGWGRSEDKTKLHEDVAKELKIPIWTNMYCFYENSDFLKIASRRTFCGGSRDGSGVCHGDSGGGLFIQSDGVFYVRGIISSSLLKAGKCDVSNFAAYTDVTQFTEWIESPDQPVNQISQSQSTQQVTNVEQTESCGVMSSAAGLIQKGIKSTAVQWPWVVIITAKDFTNLIDNESYPDLEIGSLITAKHVIADGYFLTRDDGDKRKVVSSDLVKSYFGVINIDDYASSNSLILDGAEWIKFHPNLGNIHSLKFANFAVMKLKISVTFSQYISPVCISSFKDDPYSLTGRFAYAVGMGYSETGKTKDRKHSPMRIRNKEKCDVEFEYSLSTAKNRTHYFCAGGDGRSNACWSDHPLYMKMNDKWSLHGFMQVAYNDELGCQSNMPVLYEIAGAYYEWIQSQISSED